MLIFDDEIVMLVAVLVAGTIAERREVAHALALAYRRLPPHRDAGGGP